MAEAVESVDGMEGASEGIAEGDKGVFGGVVIVDCRGMSSAPEFLYGSEEGSFREERDIL